MTYRQLGRLCICLNVPSLFETRPVLVRKYYSFLFFYLTQYQLVYHFKPNFYRFRKNFSVFVILACMFLATALILFCLLYSICWFMQINTIQNNKPVHQNISRASDSFMTFCTLIYIYIYILRRQSCITLYCNQCTHWPSTDPWTRTKWFCLSYV